MAFPKLTISVRTLLVLVLGIGIWLGWVTNKARRQREAVAAVKKHGGWVHYDYEFDNDCFVPGSQPWAPLWFRRMIGDEYFREIREVNFVYDIGAIGRASGSSANATFESCDDALALLGEQSRVAFLHMKGGQATDRGLAHLRKMSSLESLVIEDAVHISDEEIQNLKDLTHLKYLFIDHSKITDRGLLALRRLTNLERLVLHEAGQISDRGFCAVRDMKKMSCLDLSGSSLTITDASLAIISQHHDLETLDVPYSRLTDTGLIHIKDLKKLSNLSLRGCEISDTGVAQLAGLAALEYLSLAETKITDRGLEHLKGLPRLRLLIAINTSVTQEGIERLKKVMPNTSVELKDFMPNTTVD